MSIHKNITRGITGAVVVCGLLFSGCDKGGSTNVNGLRTIDEPCDNDYKCEQGLICDSGLCRKICAGDDNCNGRQKCIQGLCKNQNECRDGFTGENCGQCLPDFYSSECKPCPQCVHGKCDDGITGGGRCNCEDGFFGQLCDMEVTCKHGQPGPNGQCLSCEGHWAGDNCDQCATGWDGTDCEECDFHSFGPDCQPCDCANGRCDYGHQGRGCVCYNQWSGDHCDICNADGVYGDSCAVCTKVDGEYNHARASDCVLVDDRQKKPVTYQIVDIGGHFWMAENLKYAGGGDYRYPNDDSANVEKYGLLYPTNVGDEICPEGWRLPEWDDYERLLYWAGDKAFYNLLKNGEWILDGDYTSNDLLGFGALPAGMYNGSEWGNSGFGGAAVFLSSEQESGGNDTMILLWGQANKYVYYPIDYVSVRCIKEWCDPHKRGDKCDRCEVGWTGDDCLTPVSCVHGKFGSDGKCSGLCDDGWTGANCEYQITCSHGTLDQLTGKCVENSCDSNWMGVNCDIGKFTDTRDNQTYKMITIGDLTWLAENMRYSSSSVKCEALNSLSTTIYGCFYTWKDAQKVCPPGWHLPSIKESGSLLRLVSANLRGADSVTAALSSKSAEWKDGAVTGMDVYGFGALPIGYYNTLVSQNQQVDKGYRASFWSSESEVDNIGYSIDIKVDEFSIGSMDKRYAFPVRCIQNYENPNAN